MASFNRVILAGNLTRDPEIRHTAQGKTVADIGLAINRYGKGPGGERTEETTFVDVTLWERSADVVSQYCKKGSPLLVEGRLQTDSWNDKNTGEKRSKLKVIGDNVQLLGSKGDANGASQSSPSRPRVQAPALNEDGDPSDVPF